MKFSVPDSRSTSFCQHLWRLDFVDKDGLSCRINSWYAVVVANEDSRYQVDGDFVLTLSLHVAKLWRREDMAF